MALPTVAGTGNGMPLEAVYAAIALVLVRWLAAEPRKRKAKRMRPISTRMSTTASTRGQ
jgi:hypothetical protein